MIFQEMKWPEIKEGMKKDTIVILPIGSTEQHGYHLPVYTDICIPYYIAIKAAERTGSLVLPPINYGYTEYAVDFPGTVSVKTQTFLNYIFDICHSLSRSGFKKIVLMNGHGGNSDLVRAVVNMVTEKTDALCVSFSYFDLIKDVAKEFRTSEFPWGNCHAGDFETDIMLYLDPEHVDMSKAVKEMDVISTKYTWIDLVGSGPVYALERWSKVTKSGVVGDPTKSTKETGKKLSEAAIERVAEFLNIFNEMPADKESFSANQSSA